MGILKKETQYTIKMVMGSKGWAVGNILVSYYLLLIAYCLLLFYDKASKC